MYLVDTYYRSQTLMKQFKHLKSVKKYYRIFKMVGHFKEGQWTPHPPSKKGGLWSTLGQGLQLKLKVVTQLATDEMQVRQAYGYNG